MADLTSKQITNGQTSDASQYNPLLGSNFESDWSNATSMSGTATLTDADFAIQSFNCNGANRIVKLPAYAVSNHPFIIVNATGAAYTLDVQSSGGVTLLATPLVDGDAALVMPDGSAGFKRVGRGIWGSVNGILASLNPAPGMLINGTISPTVAGNNLTLALKTLAGADPSITDPVYVYLGGGWRTITAALSVTINAGANSFNSGSTELATKEIDYFAYLRYNATDGVCIGPSRIPYGALYSDFSATATNEKYCAWNTATHAAAGDECTVIGRFAATLSAGAGYTWTVPTFTALNLIQYPIWNTRWSPWNSVPTGDGTVTLSSTALQESRYRIERSNLLWELKFSGTLGGSASNALRATQPFTGSLNSDNMACGTGNAGALGMLYVQLSSGQIYFTIHKFDVSNFATSGSVNPNMFGQYEIG